ncbi:MAG: hypothetical protein KDA27_15725, partial [Candidatus Eisenbacteria bacterium]|nr:hypothetical protein [Candidatus Eisenbacteria bacterium]
PWLVTSKIRWALFCAITQRKFNRTLDWAPYYEVAAGGGTFEEKLDGYAKLADARLGKDEFEEFSAKQLPHLDEVAWEFFGTDAAKDAVRAKVKALFPEHEWEEFTELFFERIQEWRRAQKA